MARSLEKRHELAQTFWDIDNWAEYITENKMVKTRKMPPTSSKRFPQRRNRARSATTGLLAYKQKQDPECQGVNGWDVLPSLAPGRN